MKIVDAHSHLWLRQETSWDGKEIRSLKNGRSIFLGEEVQMMPPFILDSRNTAEVFLSNMDYAQACRTTIWKRCSGSIPTVSSAAAWPITASRISWRRLRR